MSKIAPLIKYLDSLKGRADLSILETLLNDGRIGQDDLKDLCKFGDKGYKRNLVASSPHYDCLVICWKAGQASPIHDHAGSSCAFKVIAGTASEVRYKPVQSGSDLVQRASTIEYLEGDVCSAQDEEIHKIANDAAEDLITLHIYSPPLKMNYYRESANETLDIPDELKALAGHRP